MADMFVEIVLIIHFFLNFDTYYLFNSFFNKLFVAIITRSFT